MKVDVLQVRDASFKKYWWWSDWIDISVFDWSGNGYLLQMKVSRSNAKKFKCVQFKSFSGSAHPATGKVGDLLPMSNPN